MKIKSGFFDLKLSKNNVTYISLENWHVWTRPELGWRQL
jgi:hypothetical protein